MTEYHGYWYALYSSGYYSDSDGFVHILKHYPFKIYFNISPLSPPSFLIQILPFRFSD